MLGSVDGVNPGRVKIGEDEAEDDDTTVTTLTRAPITIVKKIAKMFMLCACRACLLTDNVLSF
jgi:hypothetical protein